MHKHTLRRFEGSMLGFIDWDSQIVNAQCPLNTNDFVLTYTTTEEHHIYTLKNSLEFENEDANIIVSTKSINALDKQETWQM